MRSPGCINRPAKAAVFPTAEKSTKSPLRNGGKWCILELRSKAEMTAQPRSFPFPPQSSGDKRETPGFDFTKLKSTFGDVKVSTGEATPGKRAAVWDRYKTHKP